MYLIDTNVVSMLDARRVAHAPALIDWMERNGSILYLSVMTIAEMEAGVLKLRRQSKTARADEVARLIVNILTDFGDRVLEMDVATALHLARLSEATHRQPVALADLIIAATAARHGMTVLTRNTGEFKRLGVTMCDPFESLPPG